MDDKPVKVTEELKQQVALMQEKQWFNELIEEAQGLIVTIGDFSWDIIVKYHSLGKLLLEAIPKFKEDGRTIGEMEQIISEQVGRSTRTLRSARRFYETYPDIEKSPYTTGAQWIQVLKDLKKTELSEGKKEEDAVVDESTNENVSQPYPKPVVALDYNPGEDMWKIGMNPEDFEHIDWSDIKDKLLSYLKLLN